MFTARAHLVTPTHSTNHAEGHFTNVAWDQWEMQHYKKWRGWRPQSSKRRWKKTKNMSEPAKRAGKEVFEPKIEETQRQKRDSSPLYVAKVEI